MLYQEWVVLCYSAGAEAVMLLLLTLPGLDPLRKGLLSVTKALLGHFLWIVWCYVFWLLEVYWYWKYETRPTCDSPGACTPSETFRHQKSIIKSQGDVTLIALALLFYWVLYSVTNLGCRVEELKNRVQKLKDSNE